MARVSAANGDARAPGWRSAAAILQSLNSLAAQRLASARLWIFYAAPALAVVVFAIAALIVIAQLRLERERALGAAEREVDLRASLLAFRVDEARAANPGGAPADLLRVALARDGTREGEALVADADGVVLASEPPAGGANLAAILGPSQPLTILGEKAGVLRIETANG